MIEKLREAFKEINIECTDDQLTKLDNYMNDILEYNEHINLTAIREPEEFISKHYVDSAAICSLPEYITAKKIIDVGTGAGFPGVPLAVLDQDKEFILSDSLLKKLKIVDELTAKLEINNVETVHGRVEDLGHNIEYREKFDVCVSRAVANLSVLAEYCLPFVKVGGSMLAYKGPDVEDELKSAKKAIKTLGGRVDRIETIEIAGFSHNIIIIRKEKNTSGKYPRKAGTPSKMPIK
jgi:16S rRNA (guanine(527)-N(7))-methyltransferase GidB